MTSIVNDILANGDYFILLLFRVGGLVFASPIFGRVNIPALAKIGLIVSISFLFYTVLPQTAVPEYTTLLGFVLIAAMEILLGISLAFVTNIFFSLTAFTAGQLIDMQIGFGIVNVYDVQNNTQVPMMGNILNLMMLLIFFAVDGHLQLVGMIYLTLDNMPIGTMVLSPAIGYTAIEVFIRSFLLGIMMALPILASGLTLEIIFGMMMRAVPQIHMFVVGIPLKVIVGLVIFTVTLPVFAGFSSRVFSELFNGVESMFAAFLGA